MEATEHSDVGTQGNYSSRYSTYVESSVRDRIRREVYGDDYPAEAAPRSFLTVSELRNIAHDLDVGPDQAGRLPQPEVARRWPGRRARLSCSIGGPAGRAANSTP
jgi:hypothetical protein